MNAVDRAGARFFYSSIAERLFTNAWYSLVAKLDKHADEPFMNYGFAELDGAQIRLAAKLEPHRYAIQLYHHVVANGAVEGKDVLEIGCGRGGGASYVAATLGPRRYVGLDINKTAIACDRRFYRDQPNLEFVAGDAHALPFGDATFGVALNVESSHHYRDIGTFFGEVHRVLVPGGVFVTLEFYGMLSTPQRARVAARAARPIGLYLRSRRRHYGQRRARARDRQRPPRSVGEPAVPGTATDLRARVRRYPRFRALRVVRFRKAAVSEPRPAQDGLTGAVRGRRTRPPTFAGFCGRRG